ncbi:MAG: heparinase II/III family protein [Clostridia bacterium]|nr:heparinase II/III family protein [Clostridia bacterium]
MKRCLSISISITLFFSVVMSALSGIAYSSDRLNEFVFVNSLHAGGTTDGTLISYNGDEIHRQNGATITVKKDNNNEDYSFVKKYTGDKLTFHGANDNANNGNSGVNIFFADGINNTKGQKRFLEFNISTNANTRTYAGLNYGDTRLYILTWAGEGDIENATNHVIRVEVDRTSETPVAKVLVDDVEKTSKNLATGDASLSLWLAAYKTPTVTISKVKYGVIGDSVQNDNLMNLDYRRYNSSLITRNTVSENFDTLYSIESVTTMANGYISKDSGGSWVVTDDLNNSYVGDKSIFFNPNGISKARVVCFNPHNMAVSEISFDLMLMDFDNPLNINIKTNTGWIADRIHISKSEISGEGGGTYAKKYMPLNTWCNISVIYDGETGELWFVANDVPIYYNKFSSAYAFLNYIEILSGTSAYYIDNFEHKSYYKKDFVGELEVASSFYTANAEDGKEHVYARISADTDGKEKSFCVYGALYNGDEGAQRLVSVKRKDVLCSNDEYSKVFDMDIGPTAIGDTACIFCFDGVGTLKPLQFKHQRRIADIKEDVKLIMNFEDKSIGIRENNGIVSEFNGSKVLSVPLTANPVNLKYEALCLGDFVISFDLTSESAMEGEFVVCGGGTPAYLLKFTDGGKITAYDDTVLGSYLSGMTKVTIVFKHDTKSFDFYIDEELKLSGYLPGVTFDKCVHFEYELSSVGNNTAYIDNIIVYPPYVYTDKCFYYDKYSKPVDTDKKIVLTSETTIPNDSAQVQIMTDKVSLHTRSGVVYSNGKKNILEHMPYILNNEIMVPADFFRIVFGLSIAKNESVIKIGDNISLNIGTTKMSVSGEMVDIGQAPEIVGEICYLPLKAIVQNGMGLNLIYDESATHSGMVIISDSSYSLPDGIALQKLNDFCFYYRPDKDEFYKTYEKSGLKNSHPRIMATESDFERIRNEIKINPLKAHWYKNLIAFCEGILDEPTLKYELRDGVRLMYVSDDFENWMISLAAAYKLSGDKKYFDCAWKHIESVANMPDWNPSHHIDVGIMALGYAVAYDWFYDELSSEQRKIMEKGAYNNCLWTVNEAIKDDTTPYGWVMMNNNHNVFVNAGNMAVCLAFMDVYPEECSKIGADIVRILEQFLDKFAPLGQYYEGPHYATVAIDYTARIFSVMEPTVGLFKLDTAQGFELIGDYLTYMQSDVSNFNFADGDAGYVSSTGLFWLYNHYDIHGSKDSLANGFYYSASRDEAAQCLLWYDVEDESEDTQSLSLDIHYPQEEIITMRDSFLPGQVFVGIKAGDTVFDHSHYDVGSFVFDAMGTRWAHDLGKDDYNLYYKYGMKSVFRVRAESHNVLLIAPDSTPGFEDYKRAPVTEYVSTSDYVKAVVDMTDAYGSKVSSARRGFLFTDNRKSLVVRDEVVLNDTYDLYWLMYTDAKVKIVNNNTVILTDKVDASKQVMVEFCSSVAGKVGTESAKPFPTSVQIDEQMQNEGFNRIYYKVNSDEYVNITAKITPIGCKKTDIAKYDVSMEEW